MRIIIAGAGAVGTHLARLFSKEHHDITLIDESPERLESSASHLEVLTVCAPPSSISVLKSADVGRADLFVAVTPDEAHNMTCCMLASKLGARKTVARVDNYEYTLPANTEFFKTVGIGSIVYPEMLAGREIVHNLKHSWVRQWLEFQGGSLIMLGVKVRSTAQLLGIPLRVLCGPDTPYHIVAIKRQSETIIPHGNDVLLDGDVVYFMTQPAYVDYIRDVTGKKDYPELRQLFMMGGGHTAEQALHNLPDSLHVKVLETDVQRCEQLIENVGRHNVMVLHGDGRDPELLVEEGIRGAQAFAAVTQNSEANILACLAAKRLGIRKTVAMVENLDYIGMAESLDIGTIINKKTFAASHIYQMTLKADVTTIKSLTVANADVAEFVVREGARITRRDVMDLDLPPTVTLGGLVRGGQGYLINGKTRIEPGDMVVAFCLENAIKRIEKYFN